MSRKTCRRPLGGRRSAVPIFLAVALAIALLAAIWLGMQSISATAVAGSLLLVLLFGVCRFPRQHAAMVHDPLPRPLVSHPDLLAVHQSLTRSLCQLAGQSDKILRDTASARLTVIQQELQMLASGKVVFAGTEAWRTAYEGILRAPGLGWYFSVAWLRSEDYWRDLPGRHSMQLNYDLIQLGVRIERTLIVNDFFWPPAAVLPAKIICQWIEDQYKRGIVVRLVRESEIHEESELLCDFGIYGHRATGQLELDEQCRTTRFTLDFDPRSVQLLEQRWRRLLLFAVSYRELLDHKLRRP